MRGGGTGGRGGVRSEGRREEGEGGREGGRKGREGKAMGGGEEDGRGEDRVCVYTVNNHSLIDHLWQQHKIIWEGEREEEEDILIVI